MPIVTRFAPSPTGFLHLGHAHAALTAARFAHDPDGCFLLRLEDIDPTRCRPEFSVAVLEDLAWLGIDWHASPRVQSEHMAEYRAVLEDLAGRGLTYPCFCSRAEIAREVAASTSAPHAPDGSLRYPGTCRALPAAARRARIEAGMPYAIRLDLSRALACVPGDLSFHEEGVGRIACRPDLFGDVVLGRRDAPCSYHLCVTHDDARQGVTLVTRGRDLLPATDLHRLLQALLGWPEPAYAHHALLTDADGRRLAKRDGAATLRALRERGATPDEVRRRAELGG
jgi:glutamyl-Q tRNA(Asp) synthetase